MGVADAAVPGLVLSLIGVCPSIFNIIWTTLLKLRYDERRSETDAAVALAKQYSDGPQAALARLAQFAIQHDAAPGKRWKALERLRFPDRFLPPDPPLSTADRRQLLEDYMKLEEARIKIRGFWDGFFQLASNGRLPAIVADFKNGTMKGKWANRANNFREIVEPFDIANFFISGFGTHYARPDIYRDIETVYHAVSWRKYEETAAAQRAQLAASAAAATHRPTASHSPNAAAAVTAGGTANGVAASARQDPELGGGTAAGASPGVEAVRKRFRVSTVWARGVDMVAGPDVNALKPASAGDWVPKSRADAVAAVKAIGKPKSA